MSRLEQEFIKRQRKMKGFTAIIYAMILVISLISLGLISLAVTLIIAVLKSAGMI